MPVTIARKKVVKTIKTAKTAKTVGVAETDKDDKDGEYLKPNLAQVPCIWCLIIFQMGSILTLFDLTNKVNTIHLTFTKELGLSF